VRLPRIGSLLVMLLSGTAMAPACDGDDGGVSSTATVVRETPVSTAEVTATLSPTVQIRDVALDDLPQVRQLIAATGGQFVQAGVLYADLTEDGAEDAVVPISSGGTRGDIAFVVLSPHGDAITTVLSVIPEESSVSVAVVDGALASYEPVYGPEDPLCCPSELRTTVYAWDGERLVVESSTAGPAGVR
jgi:hypothetical protein